MIVLYADRVPNGWKVMPSFASSIHTTLGDTLKQTTPLNLNHHDLIADSGNVQLKIAIVGYY